MKKFMAALLAFAAVILFAGCGGKTVDTDSTLQGESIDADAQTNSDGQASKVISAYYLGIGLDKESRWKMTEEDKQSADGNYIKNKATEYDSHGNPLSSDTDTYKYTYNGDGTVKEIRTDGGNGYIYSYEYDSAKRITKISVVEPISGDTMNSYKFTYNKSGKLIGVDSGRVAGMDGTEYKITVSYDGSGRVSKKEKVYSGGLVKSYKYEYNSRNDISRKTEEVKQSDDYLKNVTDYKYDENGALIKLTVKSSDGSSQESVYTNDKYGNPVNIKVTKTANGKTVSSHTYPYTYKYESNRITVTEHDGSKKIYEYHKNQSIMLDDSRIF